MSTIGHHAAIPQARHEITQAQTLGNIVLGIQSAPRPERHRTLGHNRRRQRNIGSNDNIARNHLGSNVPVRSIKTRRHPQTMNIARGRRAHVLIGH